MSEPKFVSRVRLNEKYSSSYCPTCRKELTLEGKDFREIIKPLWKVKNSEIVRKQDGYEFEYFSYYYTCDRETCRDKRYTEDDLVKANTQRWDGTKWDEESKPFTCWNRNKKQWEEKTTNAY